MNSYLIETDDFSAREREVHKLIQKENFLDASLSVYDLEESAFDNVLEDLDTYQFLSSKKIIIVRHMESFKIDIEPSHFEHLLRYIKNPDSTKLLILEADHFNHTTKLFKDLEKVCKIVSFDVSPKSFIKENLSGYDISMDAIHLLDEYCLSDFTKIESECQKLKNYCYDQKKITSEDISQLVIKKLGDPRDLTFAFSRSIGLRDKSDAFKKYQELLQYQVEPLNIIGLLASQIRIIYQVKLLLKRHMSDNEIGKMLGEKEFRIKKTRELVPYYTEEDCLNFMKKLSDIDLKIKSTDTDSNRELELFLLNL